MAVDTLLETAVAVQAYTPDLAKRLFAQARARAKKHPDLGPPGKQWVLPPALRPDVFQAAARVGQRAARLPEQYSSLITSPHHGPPADDRPRPVGARPRALSWRGV